MAEQRASASKASTSASKSSNAPPTVVDVPTPPPQNQEEEECEAEEDDERGFDIPVEAEEDVSSAYMVWSTLLELILELHDEWDDHDMEERRKHAEAASMLGKAWVHAVKKHSKYTCSHYYCHVAFAHLHELIMCNGHLFCGDDSILERGHQQFKRLRAITSCGGKPIAKGVGRPKMAMIRQHLNSDGTLEMRHVEARGRPTVEEQEMMLARSLTKRREAREAPQLSAKKIASEIRKQKVRHDAKSESLQELKALTLATSTPSSS